MGLSGRKVKQRIPNDPRNLSWADNAAKFGQSYLSKLGWDPSQGLGAEGAGRTSAVKVSQKLDMLGIGMQHTRDANGIAWQQNRDFERLLARLNGEGGAEESGVAGFDRAREEDYEGSGSGEVEAEAEEEEGQEETEKERRRREKKEKKERKKREAEEAAEADTEPERKKRKKSKSNEDDADTAPQTDGDAAAALSPPARIIAPTPVRAAPRTHRARNIAAKRLASRTPAALSEILGIPSSSLPATPFPAASSSATPQPDASAVKLTDPNEGMQLDNMTKLTTATQSVGDYFKAKLAAKAGGVQREVKEEVKEEDEEERPRMGLGARAGMGNSAGREMESGGLGFGMASKFAAMLAPRAEAKEEVKVEVEVEVEIEVEVEKHVGDVRESSGQVEKEEDAKKNKSKEERRLEKEERRKREEKGKAKADAEGDNSSASKKSKKAKRADEPMEDGVLVPLAHDEAAETTIKKSKKSKKTKSQPSAEQKKDEVEAVPAKKEKRRKRDAEGGEERASKKRREDS